MEIDTGALLERVADQVTEHMIDEEGISAEIRDRISLRVDQIFEKRAEAAITAAIDEAIAAGFEREYRRLDTWGKPKGAPTSIKKEMEKLVGDYWSERVDKRTGERTDSVHGSISRAEYTMLRVCASDFTEEMQKHAQNITGHLKDGLRVQIAAHMDKMLDALFRIRSLQDQGEVGKPW